MMAKELFFVTTNKHKVAEVQEILKKWQIKVIQIDQKYSEDHDDSMEEISKKAAKMLCEEQKKTLAVEDTGFFFEAYDNFPGPLSKFIAATIGYEGIMRLLQGKTRTGYAKTVVGYCIPGKEPVIFEGIMKGRISENVYDLDKDIMPYERIFIPDGYDVTLSRLPREVKNTISHRKKAFEKLATYLNKKDF
jgi:XTP/dITP diphosphohydrolase